MDWMHRLSTPESLLGQHMLMFRAPGGVVDFIGFKSERFMIFEGPTARSFTYINPLQEPEMYVVPTIADYQEDYAFGSKSVEEVVAWIKENRDAYESVLIKPEQEEAR